VCLLGRVYGDSGGGKVIILLRAFFFGRENEGEW
jgi:hypothetical protein